MVPPIVMPFTAVRLVLPLALAEAMVLIAALLAKCAPLAVKLPPFVRMPALTRILVPAARLTEGAPVDEGIDWATVMPPAALRGRGASPPPVLATAAATVMLA